MLSHGYNKGLPPGAETAWGCRAVINPDGTVGLVGDRQSAAGPRVDELITHLNDVVRGAWIGRAEELLRSQDIRPERAREVTLLDDGTVVIKANTNASHGHLYVCAYFADELKP